MDFSGFRLCVVVFILFVSNAQLGLARNEENARDFITWDDLKVDVHMYNWNDMKKGQHMNRLDMRDGYNRSGRVIVVDRNGGAHSVTVQGAVDMVPHQNTQRVKIYILPGIYREKVLVPSSKPYISFIGNENRTLDTIITWHNKASDDDTNGSELGTYRSASVTVESDYFCATGITFENTVVARLGGVGMQAVALRIGGDKAMFYKVRFIGAQDTLLDESGSHYLYQCHIQGAVDFIFGRAKSLYEDCVLQSTAKRSGAIAAHHRDSPNDDTGFSFVNCVINGTGDVYLGRAWGDYSRVIYSYCDMSDIVTPEGWSDWNIPSRQNTSVFVEYQCRGRGAHTRHRVPWAKSFSHEEVRPFLDMKFINGEQWLKL
ncbi:hypothetical protein L1049_000884 [Liquidambar formosana]|uniref:Pectinesterase n=1 Tax=Liquidambar formosana TaxID=63359 RepID=A0AAP0R543_LIQFO